MKFYKFPSGFQLYSVRDYKDFIDQKCFDWFSIIIGLAIAYIIWAFIS